MDCSTPGFPVHHQLPNLAQSHVHQVGDTIQLSHSLLNYCTISLISHASKVMQSLKNRENKTKPEKTEVDPEAVEHGSKQWIISLHSFRYCLTWPVLGNSLLWLFKNQWKLKKNKKKNVVSHLPSFGNVGRVLLIRFAIPKLGGAESHLHSCFAFLGILSPHWVFWSLRVGHLHAASLFHSQTG